MSLDTSQLNTNELAVLESLHGAPKAISQRELARRTGLSVGLINAVIKKLVSTGYVKTSHLNRRSIDYLLTPSGFAQTALKSYRYVLSTVRNYRTIQTRLHGLLERLSIEGISEFYLHGDGELAELVATFFQEEGKGELRRGQPARKSRKVAVLNAVPTPVDGTKCRVVDLVIELGNGYQGSGNRGRGIGNT